MLRNELVKALPIRERPHDELQQAFSLHLEETKGHVECLRHVFLFLREKPSGKHCNGMEGLNEKRKKRSMKRKRARHTISD